MQTQSIKAIRTNDNRLFIFYHSSGSIFCRQIDTDMSENTVKIMDNVSPGFSLWADMSGIYLLLGGMGGIHLCYYNFVRWVSRPMSKDFDPNCTKLSFFSMGESVHLLYSVKDSAGNEGLYARSMKKENWSAPSKIADIMPFHSSPYFTGRESPDKVRVYYRLSDKTIRFRTLSLTDGSVSEAENLLATNLPCSDISILTKGQDCHILYLAQGMFSSQLIYKGIRAGVQSRAKVIWEGQLSGSCSLFLYDSRLYALIYNDAKSYVMYSDEGGKAFSSAKNLGSGITPSCLKAEYMDFCGFDSFAADETIIDISSLTFPVISDICPSFIPRKTAAPSQRPEPDAVRKDTSLRAAEYEEQLSSMSSQLSELSKTLAKRNEEIAAVAARWRAKYNSLMKENETLRARISQPREVSLRTAADTGSPSVETDEV